MKNPVLEQLDQLRSARDSARDAAIQMAAAEDFDPNDSSFTDLEARAAKYDSQIERLVGLLDAQKSADALDGKLSRSATRVEERAEKPDNSTWGETFVRSDAYREYNFRGTSSKVDIEMRALPHSLASMADALPSSPIYDLTPTATPNLILPLVSTVQVSGNSVDYIVWSKVSGNAAVVAENTLKPSIEWEPSVTSRSLATIAAHTSFTRQLAEDASAVQSFLTNELQNEVRRKVEAEAVAAISAAVLPAATGPAGAGLLGAIRKGKAEVEANGFTPNAFLVNADDLIELDIEVMSTAGTAPNQTNSYWGLTPVVDTAGVVAAGTVIVGDFKRGVQHYARNTVSLYLTDSHGENFRYNILDAIAETRGLTAVVRPDALVETTAGV
ncbi:phage major capsid protein [Nocardioides antri]|uniref:Phage major capsid protein n=1 Tax=Nocardioides antri TaxID=2607659 RepID=A0A5B1LUX0_9ACTN|nr:phage major capsid protein [Nocardioides antri]KAA1424316.1 phage major capsid protein [Nocardioides antri]